MRLFRIFVRNFWVRCCVGLWLFVRGLFVEVVPDVVVRFYKDIGLCHSKLGGYGVVCSNFNKGIIVRSRSRQLVSCEFEYDCGGDYVGVFIPYQNARGLVYEGCLVSGVGEFGVWVENKSDIDIVLDGTEIFGRLVFVGVRGCNIRFEKYKVV